MNFSERNDNHDRAPKRSGWTPVNRVAEFIETEAAASSFLQNAPRFHCGQTLRFRLADVYAPGLSDLFNQITPELELQGRISFLSDGGEVKNSYAVVEVPGILMPLIVPASCIEMIPETSDEPLAAT